MWILLFPSMRKLIFPGGLRYAGSKSQHEALSAVGAA
jgi:hypothetical protein